jgi:competence protein ComEA
VVIAGWRLVLFGLITGPIASAVILILARGSPGHPVELIPPADPPRIQVFVRGAVRATGVYALPAGSLVEHALQAAGGVLPQADLERLNLAAPLSAGDEVRVQFLATAVLTPLPGFQTAAPAPGPDRRVNVNTASFTELDSLPGIGPTLAQRIIDEREEHGPFSRVEDLLRASGIGQALLEKIRNLVKVE